MPACAVIGGQWGDEGKAAVVDRLAKDVDAVIRYNGGPNAGHTLVINGEETILHNLSVGVVWPGKWSVVGPYVLCDLETVIEELKIARSHGAHVLLDPSAPIILPIHREIDGAREARANKNAIGTTGRGVGPAYEDWVGRRGITLGDLKTPRRIREALSRGGYYSEKIVIAQHLGLSPMDYPIVADMLEDFAPSIIPYLGDSRAFVASSAQGGDKLLFEGAQGMMLHVLSGPRPYTTSSFCGRAAIHASFGMYDEALETIGVIKPYTTYLGGGPFPTEFNEEQAEWFREHGKEYGATTGRPRRCGRLDLVALRYACRMGGINKLILTKLDILSGLQKIEVCDEYVGVSTHTTLTREVLESARARYCSLNGWGEDISFCCEWCELPENAKKLIQKIESFVGIPVVAAGVGPEREQMICASGEQKPAGCI